MAGHSRSLGGLLAIFLLWALSAAPQTTSVSGQVIDAAGVQWKNGTYSFTFRPNPTNPGPYRQSGAPFNSGQAINGSLDATGSFAAVAVADNNTVFPGGSQWTVQVCPAATASNGCFSVNVTVTGATQTITSSLTPPAVQVAVNQPPVGYSAYNDAEIVGAKQGSFYTNLTDGLVHICSTTPPCVWTAQINTSGDNTWTNNQRFKGPIPWVDVTAGYGVRPVATVPSTTATMAAGSTTATLAAASTFQNGDGVVIYGAGATNTTPTPTAPTLTPSLASGPTGMGLVVTALSGTTTYNYQVVARRQNGGLTVASPVSTTAIGNPLGHI